jgi:DHA1 family bicyclomycin/chloramphenicol resistance-like MFS transporter
MVRCATTMTAPAESPRPRAPNALLLAVITGSGTLGMHIFVPALPSVAADLAASPAAAQLTITLYLVGVALAQLVYGPISDRLGRRPTLVGGLVIYAAGSVLGAAAGSLETLIAARVLQAVGACGGLVLGRAMVRDVSGDDRVAARMALLNMAMMLAPASAPILGGAAVALAGWRSILLLLAVLSTGLLAAVLLALPETLPRRARPSGLGSIAVGYGRLLRNPMFLVFAFGGACSTTSVYAFLSASPFLFLTVLGRGPDELAICYIVLLIGYSGGNFVANRIAGTTGPQRALRLGCTLATVAAVLMLLADRSGALSVWTLMAPMLLFAFGTGIASPNAAAGAVSVDLRHIGAASGLYGFSQMAYGALCTFVVGAWRDGTALPVATVLLVSAVLGQLTLAAGTRAAPGQPRRPPGP